MDFLAMIIALSLLQAWGHGNPVHKDDWFRGWQTQVANWSFDPRLRLALAVLSPAVLAALILDALEPALFGLLWMLMAVVLLLYAWGRGDYHRTLERYRNYCRNGDFEGAWLAAESEWQLIGLQDSPGSSQEVHRAIQRGFFYQGYQRWFGVLFFYWLLGPAGALAYRLLQLCRGSLESELSDRVLFLLDWVPSRLLAAVFVVMGDFVASRDVFLGFLTDTRTDAATVLYSVGSAAQGGTVSASEEPSQFGQRAADNNRAAEELLARSAGVWIVALSVLVLLPL